jgi:tetratricopeptide (TPR) repeat protein
VPAGPGLRYTSDVGLAGRRRELAEVGRVLDGAADGRGCVLAITGPRGSGRTELATAATREAARRGFTVLRTAAIPGQPGVMAWARLLADAGAPGDLASRVVDDADPLELDSAARVLSNGSRRLLMIDDIDLGGADALHVLRMVAARVPAAETAVIVTSVFPLGVGTQLPLAGLTEDELADVAPGLAPQARHGVWLASGGLPGVARGLAAELAAGTGAADPLVQLALTAPSQAEFLDINTGLIRLLELALPQAPDVATRARLLGRLARELLADSTAGPQRRALTDEAVKLARESRDPGVLAEVLDARLNALWDPPGAEDRLAAAAEIIDLARAAGDGARERDGMFWRFVALMELARVAEAESALAAFHRAAAAAGDVKAVVMATARQAMLANLHGRFGQATELIAEVAAEGPRAGLPDTYRVVGSVWAEIAFYCGPQAASGLLGQKQAGVRLDQMQALARRLPGHFMEAGIAVWLTLMGRTEEAQTELDRILPAVLAGSGPRQLGSAAALAFVATQSGDVAAAARLRDALLPYRGQLALFGGAGMCLGPVSLFLGLAATQLGLLDEAVESLRQAIAFAERSGALPCLALSLQAASRALSLRQAPGDRNTASAFRDRALAVAGRLGMSEALSRRVAAPAHWSLRRDGEDWLLQAGSEHARLRDSRGLHYLGALLAAPGSDIPALDLAAGGPGLAACDTGPLLDDAARDAYRARIRGLDSELAAADRAGDSVRAERIHDEREALATELRRATGLSGRQRRTSAEAERARVNVTRTLRAAIDRIARAAPIAGAHLDSSIRTGIVCRYQPAPGGPDGWHT